jgi:hypothetical protein
VDPSNDFLKALNEICGLAGGPMLVALFYWFRFHTLKGTRSYTTRAFFYFGVTCFILPFIFIYYLLVGIKLIPIAAVWVLILIWLIPIVPKKWRAFCHELARIPTYAHRLRDVLATAEFAVRPEDAPVLRRKLARIGYHMDDYQAVQSTAIQSRFLKISAIMHHLEEWQVKRPPFIERHSEHYADLLQVYDILSLKAVRVLKNVSALHSAVMDDSKVEPDDWQALSSFATKDNSQNRLQCLAQTTAGGMLEDLRKDMDFMLDNLLLFLARSVLSSERNSASRRRKLEAIGFTVNRPPPSIIPAAWTVALITCAWAMIWFVFMGDQLPLIGDERVAVTRMLVLPSLNLILNFWMVTYFKRHYAFANENLFGGLPVLFILSVGLLTAALLFPVRAVFDYLQLHPYVHDGVTWTFPELLLHSLPLSLFPWSTGAVTAVLAQNSIWGKDRPTILKRVLDGAVFGTGMLVTIIVLRLIHSLLFIPQMVRPNGTLLDATTVYVLTFVFGFVVGFLALERVREGSAPRRSFYWRSMSDPAPAHA